jgi:hypothetical protein
MPTRTIAPLLAITILAVLLFTAACSMPEAPRPAAGPVADPPTTQPLAQLQPLQTAASTTEPLTATLVVTATAAALATTPPAILPTATAIPILTATSAITSERPLVEETTSLSNTAATERDSMLVVLADIPPYPEAVIVERENPVATALAKGIQRQSGNGEVEFQLATVPNEVRFEEVESFYGVALAGWRQDPHKFQQETGSGIIEGRTWTLRKQQLAVILFSDPTGDQLFLLTVLMTLP